MSAMETLLAPADLLPRLDFRVWGIDPSSKRIAVASFDRGRIVDVDNVKLDEDSDRTLRFGKALQEQIAFFERFPKPAMVFLEEPFMPRDRREAPTHLLMYGVTLAALGHVLGAIPVVELGPAQWKARALGQGNGHCKPPVYLAWAQSVGYSGRIEDEAAAIGVAVGGAHLYLSQERARTAA